MNGIVSVIKPPGLSSHDMVSWARKSLNTRKVGHAGTLDPGAAGVLVLGIGKGTRVIEFIQETRKTYRAEMTLGLETISGDLFGEVIANKEINPLSELEWQAIFDNYIGKQKQLPPMTSALKKDGVPLYKIARSGNQVTRESREIIIDDLKLVSLYQDKVVFDVTCSKGTYIRVLCQDLAKASNNLGTMSFLLRTRVGCFNLENSITMNEAIQLLPLYLAVQHLPQIILIDNLLEMIKNGMFINVHQENTNVITVLNTAQELVAIATIEDGLLKPKKVFI